jgi:hypothetical protein
MTERRIRRSALLTEAITRFLEAIRRARELDALALCSEHGFIAGSGNVDLEWMGLQAAARKRSEMDWDTKRLHVEPVVVNHETLYLVAMGGEVRDEHAISGIMRILG